MDLYPAMLYPDYSTYSVQNCALLTNVACQNVFQRQLMALYGSHPKNTKN